MLSRRAEYHCFRGEFGGVAAVAYFCFVVHSFGLFSHRSDAGSDSTLGRMNSQGPGTMLKARKWRKKHWRSL